MSEHMSKRGNFSLNMMKGSCSTQLSIDYTDEKDFYEKIRLANCLSPVIAFMCDNTPYFEGSVSPLNMMRARIWDSVDPVSFTHLDVYKRQIYFNNHISCNNLRIIDNFINSIYGCAWNTCVI